MKSTQSFPYSMFSIHIIDYRLAVSTESLKNVKIAGDKLFHIYCNRMDTYHCYCLSLKFSNITLERWMSQQYVLCNIDRKYSIKWMS